MRHVNHLTVPFSQMLKERGLCVHTRIIYKNVVFSLISPCPHLPFRTGQTAIFPFLAMRQLHASLRLPPGLSQAPIQSNPIQFNPVQSSPVHETQTKKPPAGFGAESVLGYLIRVPGVGVRACVRARMRKWWLFAALAMFQGRTGRLWHSPASSQEGKTDVLSVFFPRAHDMGYGMEEIDGRRCGCEWIENSGFGGLAGVVWLDGSF